VDVIARDHNGKPVENLKQSDFTVYEDGKKQEIAWFAMESDQTREKATRTLASSQPNTYSNLLEQKTGVPGNLTIILLDYLNTPHSDMIFGREQVMNLLHQMQPQDRVAVYALSGRLYVLHDFTSDMTALERSVRGYEMPESGDAFNSQLGPQFTGDFGMDTMINQANQNLSDDANIDRAFTTAQVFEIIAQHMLRIPGRKNLVWISSSFPLSIGMDKEGDNSESSPYRNGAAIPFGVSPDKFSLGQAQSGGPHQAPSFLQRENRLFTDDVAAAGRALAGSNIALYPVDPRGLIGNFGPGQGFAAAGGSLGPLTITNANFTLADFAPTIDTMKDLAERTGGQAFYNTNDIGGSVRKAIEDARLSYMLSYYPPQDNGRGDFHKIRVKVNRPGIELRYRSGYMAKPLNFTGTTDNSKSVRDVLFSPLDATGVGMTVHVDPFDNEGKRKLNLLIKLEERDLTFHPGDGRTLGTLQVVLAQFDTEGKEIVGETSKVDMRLLKDTYQKIRNGGLHFGRNLVLNPNATELRVVVCDDKTGAIGSLSIPLAKYFPAAGR